MFIYFRIVLKETSDLFFKLISEESGLLFFANHSYDTPNFDNFIWSDVNYLEEKEIKVSCKDFKLQPSNCFTIMLYNSNTKNIDFKITKYLIKDLK